MTYPSHEHVSEKAARLIDASLTAIERDQGARILFAIESGSRAWGFPSPDSDYDVRFVYVLPRARYLKIFPERDVIELPLVDDWDINGWDLRKALKLLLKSNPVLREWLDSPIRYRWDEAACKALSDLARQVDHRSVTLHHYLKDGRQKWPNDEDGSAGIRLKTYFYALRSALALRWLRLNPDVAPPMEFARLRAGTALDPAIETRLDELLARKKETKERDHGLRLDDIDAFLEAEFAWARTASFEKPAEPSDLVDQADALFRKFMT